jgi:hypothetical protein
VEFLDKLDIQKPLGYCGHKHRSIQAAEKCEDRSIGWFVDLCLADGRLDPDKA